MKLATYKDGSRDGQLVVVSSDLSTAHHASAIASRMQQVLDDWAFLAPQLHDLSRTLDEGRARHAFPFEPRMCMAPLPRACRAVEAQIETEAASAEPSWQALPGDGLLGACDEVTLAGAPPALAVAPRWIALTGELPLGSSPDQALDGVRLVGAGLQWVQPGEVSGGRPWLSLAPVVMTPEAVLAGDRLALALAPTGLEPGVDPSAEAALSAPLGPLLARLACGRGVRAGTLVTLGPPAQPLGAAARVALVPRAVRGQAPLGGIDVGVRRVVAGAASSAR
ncbi:MAG: hypothetical protein RLZZ592_127 [Pseudomonadota bacterium]